MSTLAEPGYGADWSDDGQLLVYGFQAVGTPAPAEVHVASPGGPARRVGPIGAGAGRFSSTERVVLIQDNDLWSVGPDGADLRRLTEAPEPKGSFAPRLGRR